MDSNEAIVPQTTTVLEASGTGSGLFSVIAGTDASSEPSTGPAGGKFAGGNPAAGGTGVTDGANLVDGTGVADGIDAVAGGVSAPCAR